LSPPRVPRPTHSLPLRLPIYTNAEMSEQWNDEHFDDCESENRAPTASPFVMRMNADVAKRQSTAQLNELRKTADGRNMLRKMGYQVDAPKRGAKAAEADVNPLTGGLQAPKIVKHSEKKTNDNKVWTSETWSKSTYVF